jgi:hypothetical protein
MAYIGSIVLHNGVDFHPILKPIQLGTVLGLKRKIGG